MKLNRYSLRRLIENVIMEQDEDPSKFHKEKSTKLIVTKEAAPDNKNALKVAAPNAVAKILKIELSGDYYAWAGNDQEEGKKLGSVRYSKGDPYTYEALSGGYYRVMSGPYSSKKRDNGKTIGATPIGAKFKPSSPPKITISDIVITAENLSLTFNGNTMSNPIVKQANQDLATLINDSISKDDPSLVPQRLQDFINTGPVFTNQLKTLEEEPFKFFGPNNADRAKNLSKIKEIYRTIGDVTGRRDWETAADTIYTRVLKIKHKGGSQPASGGGQAEPVNESFSRGSLLRRRYRRY